MENLILLQWGGSQAQSPSRSLPQAELTADVREHQGQGNRPCRELLYPLIGLWSLGKGSQEPKKELLGPRRPPKCLGMERVTEHCLSVARDASCATV